MHKIKADIKALCAQIGGQQEAARRLDVDPRTVRRWCAAGACPWLFHKALVGMVAKSKKAK